MKVSSSPMEGSQVVLEMEIEPARVEKAMDRAYRRMVARINIPGFRKGKAPRHLVERMVGREALMNEALEILVPEAYDEAVQETGIDPVTQPQLDIVSAEPLSVKATVSVRPSVKLGNYQAIRQTEEQVETTEEQVDSALERVREARSEWHKVERPIQAGDLVHLEIGARTDAKTLLENSPQRAIVDPERPILAPGVVEQIIGMKADEEKAFDATLPEDFGDAEVAGREAAIQVKVNEVREKHLPELNEELSQAVGGFATVEEMRAAARTELENQSKAQARQAHEEAILSAVVDQAELELPVAWVHEQADSLLDGARRRLGREGLTLEQFLQFSNMTAEQYHEELETTARRQLKRTLVLDAVAGEEGITVSDEEVDAAYQEAMSDQQAGTANTTNIDVARTKANIREVLKERKTVRRLVDIAEGKGDSEASTPDTETAGQTAAAKSIDEPVTELEPANEEAPPTGSEQ